MSQAEDVRQNNAYRLSLWCLGVLATGVLATVIGVIIEAAIGNALILVISLVTMAVGVFAGWGALFMLLRWARARQRLEGITTFEALMQVRSQLDTDVRRFLGRG